MFISDDDKKCLKQKNYKDLEIAVGEYLKTNDIEAESLHSPQERSEIASVIEVIYKDVYCSGEETSDIIYLIELMLKSQIKVEPPKLSESCLNYLDLKLKYLEQIPQPEQRTKEWYEFRNNRLTASDLWYIANWNDSKAHDILKKKCGVEKPFKPGLAILHGIKFEPVATKIYEMRNNIEIVEFGCLPHPTIPFFGASPDGICGIKSNNKDFVGRMLEIKCPKSRVITGFIPEVYQAQMQGQLEVCDLDYCDFLECDLQTYDTKEAYFEDSFIKSDGELDYSRTKNGFEKGVIFETYDTKTNSYDYKYNYNGFSSLETLEEWEGPLIDTILESDNLEYRGTTLWYLNNISCVLVARDREWFKEHFQYIKRFWDMVEDARINGIPEKKKKQNIVENKIDMTQFTGTQGVKPTNVEIDFNS